MAHFGGHTHTVDSFTFMTNVRQRTESIGGRRHNFATSVIYFTQAATKRV